MTELEVQSLIIESIEQYLKTCCQNEVEIEVALATHTIPKGLKEIVKNTLHQIERKQRALEIKSQFELQKFSKESILGSLTTEEALNQIKKLEEQKESLSQKFSATKKLLKTASANFIRPSSFNNDNFFASSHYADILSIDRTDDELNLLVETINTFKPHEKETLLELLEGEFRVIAGVVQRTHDNHAEHIKPFLIKMHWAKEISNLEDNKAAYENKWNNLAREIQAIKSALNIETSATSINGMKQQLCDEFLEAFNQKADVLKAEFDSDKFLKKNTASIFSLFTKSLHMVSPLSPGLFSALRQFDAGEALQSSITKLKAELLAILNSTNEQLKDSNKTTRISALIKVLSELKVDEKTQLNDVSNLFDQWKKTVLANKTNEETFQSRSMPGLFCSPLQNAPFIKACQTAIDTALKELEPTTSEHYQYTPQ